MPQPEKRRWKLQSPAGWRHKVGSWEWHPTGDGGYTKSGSCPICHDAITITKTGRVTVVNALDASNLKVMVKAELGPIIVRSDGDEPDTFYARCNCGEEHPGRPAQLNQGCGAWGDIAPPS